VNRAMSHPPASPRPMNGSCRAGAVWPLPPSTMTVLVVRGSHNMEEGGTHDHENAASLVGTSFFCTTSRGAPRREPGGRAAGTQRAGWAAPVRRAAVH
jgi:hypothetical protein